MRLYIIDLLISNKIRQKYNFNFNTLIKSLQSYPRVKVQTDESRGYTSLSIDSVKLEDSSVFTLNCQNSAGKATLSFNLRVIGKFPFFTK